MIIQCLPISQSLPQYTVTMICFRNLRTAWKKKNQVSTITSIFHVSSQLWFPLQGCMMHVRTAKQKICHMETCQCWKRNISENWNGNANFLYWLHKTQKSLKSVLLLLIEIVDKGCGQSVVTVSSKYRLVSDQLWTSIISGWFNGNTVISQLIWIFPHFHRMKIKFCTKTNVEEQWPNSPTMFYPIQFSSVYLSSVYYNTSSGPHQHQCLLSKSWSHFAFLPSCVVKCSTSLLNS